MIGISKTLISQAGIKKEKPGLIRSILCTPVLEGGLTSALKLPNPALPSILSATIVDTDTYFMEIVISA